MHLYPTFQALVAYGVEELGQGGKNDDPASSDYVYTHFDEDAIHNIMEKSKVSLERQTQEKKSTYAVQLSCWTTSHMKGEFASTRGARLRVCLQPPGTTDFR